MIFTLSSFEIAIQKMSGGLMVRSWLSITKCFKAEFEIRSEKKVMILKCDNLVKDRITHFLLFRKEESVCGAIPEKPFPLISKILVFSIICLLFSIREADVGEKSQ